MIRRVMILFLILGNFVFSAIKNLDELKTIKFDVQEKIKLNGNSKNERVMKYSISYEIPRKIRKEILAPELNKGELYIYDGQEKLIYLPIFDEYKKTISDEEENRIVQTINRLMSLERSDSEFRKEYQAKKLISLLVDDNSNNLVKIKGYTEKEGYILPEFIEILENNISLGEIRISNIEINPKFSKEEFNLERSEK